MKAYQDTIFRGKDISFNEICTLFNSFLEEAMWNYVRFPGNSKQDWITYILHIYNMLMNYINHLKTKNGKRKSKKDTLYAATVSSGNSPLEPRWAILYGLTVCRGFTCTGLPAQSPISKRTAIGIKPAKREILQVRPNTKYKTYSTPSIWLRRKKCGTRT